MIIRNSTAAGFLASRTGSDEATCTAGYSAQPAVISTAKPTIRNEENRKCGHRSGLAIRLLPLLVWRSVKKGDRGQNDHAVLFFSAERGLATYTMPSKSYFGFSAIMKCAGAYLVDKQLSLNTAYVYQDGSNGLLCCVTRSSSSSSNPVGWKKIWRKSKCQTWLIDAIGYFENICLDSYFDTILLEIITYKKYRISNEQM